MDTQIINFKPYRVTKFSALFLYALLLLFSAETTNAKEHVLQAPDINNEMFMNSKQEHLLVAFNATWCPHCRKQNKNLYQLSISDEYKDKAGFYTVDWDKRDDKNHDKIPAPKQRTTIVYYKNGKMMDQLIGGTGTKQIKAFLDKYLMDDKEMMKEKEMKSMKK